VAPQLRTIESWEKAMGSLEGKAALVTGGSRGIGAAVALRLAADGADVAITYQNSIEAAHEVVAKIESLGRRSIAIRADNADPAAVRRAVDAAAQGFDQLDILVNNAGIARPGPFDSLTIDDIDTMLNVNLRGAIVAAQAAVPHMSAGGRIVSMGSCLAEHATLPGSSLYATTKAALVGLTKALARELGPRGVTVNLIQPGPIDTDMNRPDAPGSRSQRRMTALGRFGTAEEVASLVAYLATEEAGFITGAVHTIDGGVNA
jgi:3-oxoacyl-[acyl-carrier protein] reductase